MAAVLQQRLGAAEQAAVTAGDQCQPPVVHQGSCWQWQGLLLVDEQASGGQMERLQRWPLAELPLSCDALVLTPAELEQRFSDGSRMAAELNRDLRWVL